MSIMEYDAFKMLFGPLSDQPDFGMTSSYEFNVLMALSTWFKPEAVVEIGVYKGLTAKNILGNSPWIKRYTGVDIDSDKIGEEFIRAYSESNELARNNREVQKEPGAEAKSDPRFRMVLLDNENALKVEDVAPADMIFIDGDHRYEAVKRDSAIARKALRNNRGVLVWHDYADGLGVVRYIDECNIADGQKICLVEKTSICFEVVK